MTLPGGVFKPFSEAPRPPPRGLELDGQRGQATRDSETHARPGKGHLALSPRFADGTSKRSLPGTQCAAAHWPAGQQLWGVLWAGWSCCFSARGWSPAEPPRGAGSGGPTARAWRPLPGAILGAWAFPSQEAPPLAKGDFYCRWSLEGRGVWGRALPRTARVHCP